MHNPNLSDAEELRLHQLGALAAMANSLRVAITCSSGWARKRRLPQRPRSAVRHSSRVSAAPSAHVAPAPGMLFVPGGTFDMGDERFYPEERPVHRVEVDGFWMDEHPVTAAEFRTFRARDKVRDGR